MSEQDQKYTLTEEHRAQLSSWTKYWIDNTLSVNPMTTADRAVCRDAVQRLYRASNLTPPPVHRIIFVPSPFMMCFVAGFSAAIWYSRRQNKNQYREGLDRTDLSSPRLDATSTVSRDTIQYSVVHGMSDVVGKEISSETYCEVSGATYRKILTNIEEATVEATGDAVHDAVNDHRYDHRYGQINTVTRKLIHNATSNGAALNSTLKAVRSVTRNLMRNSILDEILYSSKGMISDSTLKEVCGATHDVIVDAVYDATHNVTIDAAHNAVYGAIQDERDLSKWYSVPGDMREVADIIGVGQFGLECATCSFRMWQGGNQWSGWDSFISFFRYVVGLPLDYYNWDPWEILARNSGPRIVHEDFCLISDRPEILTVDDQNRPHNDTGPFCRWRDGSALYAVHGVRVPGWVIEFPETVTVERIAQESNLEVRRVMIDRYGIPRYLVDAGASLLHRDDWGALYRLEPEDDEAIVMVKVVNSTRESDGTYRDYWLRVHPELRPLLQDGTFGEPQEITARNAVASTFGMRGEEYTTDQES